MRTAGVVAASVVVLVMAAGLGGYVRQRVSARRVFAALRDAAQPQHRPLRHDEFREGLPDVVQRWLVRAIPDGTIVPQTFTVEQEGFFRMAPGQPGAKMTARQVYSVVPAAFAWDADIRIGGIPFFGLDYLSEDEGVFSARLLGLIQVASGSDRDVRRSSMLRYLGELAWLPYAAVGNDAIRWEAVDERRARVHFTSGNETVSGVFEFDDEGRPIAFSAMRPRDVDGRSEPTPWRGEYWDFVRVEGVEVPMSARVSWELAEGPFTYWEARMHGHRFVR